MEDPDIDERIILKLMLNRMGGRRLDSHVVDRAMQMDRQVLQMQGMPQLAEQLLTSQEGPRSMKVISAQLG